jgi:short-subunit dehydrogenase
MGWLTLNAAGYFILMTNKWALVTGASQGIGYEFAKLFAADGWHLVLVARDNARLTQIAGELSAAHGIKTKVLARDLSRSESPLEIFSELQREQIPVTVLVNNAGFGAQGPFAQVDLQTHLDLAQVNMTSLMHLTHLFLKPMLAAREGRILNVASIAAFQPGPFFASYYASKAFVYSFSCALGEELKGTGVTVTTLCPGITTSKFHARANLKRQAASITLDAATVAKMGYRALLAGRPIIVTGWYNKIAVTFSKALPTRWSARVAAKANKRA